MFDFAAAPPAIIRPAQQEQRSLVAELLKKGKVSREEAEAMFFTPPAFLGSRPNWQSRFTTAQRAPQADITTGLTLLNSTTGGTTGTATTAFDDGWFAVPLPFAFPFVNTAGLAANWTTVFISTNGYFTFNAGAANYQGFSANTPPQPVAMFGGRDNSCNDVRYGTRGGAFYVRANHGVGTSDFNSPTVVREYYFYPDGRLMVIMAGNGFQSMSSGVWFWGSGAAYIAGLGLGVAPNLATLATNAAVGQFSYTYYTVDGGVNWTPRSGSYTD